VPADEKEQQHVEAQRPAARSTCAARLERHDPTHRRHGSIVDSPAGIEIAANDHRQIEKRTKPFSQRVRLPDSIAAGIEV
jgi:hypothetical protein